MLLLLFADTEANFFLFPFLLRLFEIERRGEGARGSVTYPLPYDDDNDDDDGGEGEGRGGGADAKSFVCADMYIIESARMYMYSKRSIILI